MAPRLLFALLLLGGFAAFAQEKPPISVSHLQDGSTVIVMSPEASKACADQGGCRIVSSEEFYALLQKIKPHLCNERGA